MKIERIDYFPIELPRIEPFKIASGTSLVSRNVVVRVEAGGQTGWGNASPNTVTQETIETISASLDLMIPILVEKGAVEITPLMNELDKIISENPAAKAGLDIALHDLLGKTKERPTCDVLGRVKECQQTDVTLGIDDPRKNSKDAKRWISMGFKALKIKVGLDLDEDIRRVAAVRNAVGSKIKLWVDANQGYTVQEAVTFSKEVEHLDIEFMEQPVNFDDLDSLGKVNASSPIPIMADEAVKTPEDARKIVKTECADMINIKLMKCGGIVRAKEIAIISKDAGLPNMIGCMSESVISIAGALHFALSEENVRYADLDSHYMLKEDVAEGIVFKDGCLHPSETSGLGLDVFEETLKGVLL